MSPIRHFHWPELGHLAIPRLNGVWEILLPKYNWHPLIKKEREWFVGRNTKQPLPLLEDSANRQCYLNGSYL